MGNKTSKTEERKVDADDEYDESQEGAQKPSYYTMMKQAYQSLVNAIIRPPRSEYETSQLGPTTFQFCGKTFQRNDFELTNPRNQKFVCSMWEPVAADRPNKVLPCVIYMHGNSSCRLEALSSLSLVLSLGATLLCLDFSGSGKSEGEYVTLGFFEKDDLDCVIQYLRDSGTTSTIALWGRSMGAATALLHGERDPSIAGMVLDSAFADLVMLSEELVDRGREKGLFAPGMLVKLALKFVRSSVLKQAGFDIRLLSPIEHADKCFIPAMFVAAEGDNFVGKQHSEKIFAKYGGDKNIVLVEGDHNSARPLFMYDSVSIFLVNTLQIPDEWILPEGQAFIRKYPWTYRARMGLGGVSNGQTQKALAQSIAVQYVHNSDSQRSEGLDEDEDDDLQAALAMSLLESQEAILKADGVETAPHMEADAAMQADVQNRLYDLLSGTVGAAGKGTNRTGKPNTPVVTPTAAEAAKEKAAAAAAEASANKKSGHHLALSSELEEEDDDEEDSILLPGRSGTTSSAATPKKGQSFLLPSGLSSPSTDPLHPHPKALANKNYGKESSFNKVFGSFHSPEEEEEMYAGETPSGKLAHRIEDLIQKGNTALNSKPSGKDEDFGLSKGDTLTEYDMNDHIEYDLDAIRFHSRNVLSLKMAISPLEAPGQQAGGDAAAAAAVTAEEEKEEEPDEMGIGERASLSK